MLISDRTRYGMALARNYLRSALAALPQDAATDTARHVLPALIHDFDSKIGEEEGAAPGDHDEDTDRYGVADGWHARDGAAVGALVPVEPFRSAGLRLPARGDCRSAYKPRREFASVNPDMGIVSDPDPDRCGLPGHHEREC